MLIEKLFNIKNIRISLVLGMVVIYPLLKLSGEDSIKFMLLEIIFTTISKINLSELYIMDIPNHLFSLDKIL
jgi:hypothetical protein